MQDIVLHVQDTVADWPGVLGQVQHQGFRLSLWCSLPAVCGDHSGAEKPLLRPHPRAIIAGISGGGGRWTSTVSKALSVRPVGTGLGTDR